MNEEKEVRNACRRKLKEPNELYLSAWNKTTTFLQSKKKLLGVLNEAASEKNISCFRDKYYVDEWFLTVIKITVLSNFVSHGPVY